MHPLITHHSQTKHLRAEKLPEPDTPKVREIAYTMYGWGFPQTAHSLACTVAGKLKQGGICTHPLAAAGLTLPLWLGLGAFSAPPHAQDAPVWTESPTPTAAILKDSRNVASLRLSFPSVKMGTKENT